MIYREFSHEQLLKKLDEMREEKAAAIQRVLELEDELRQKKSGANLRANKNKAQTKKFTHDAPSVEPKIAHNPKDWMKVGAWIILGLIAMPALFGLFNVIMGPAVSYKFLFLAFLGISAWVVYQIFE